MIILLHGDHSVASRQELTRIKQENKNKEIRVLHQSGLTDALLVQAIASKTLLGGDVLVVIENLLTKLGRKTTRIKEIATILKNSDSVVVLWEDKEIGPATIKLFEPVDARLFKIPSVIFQFLDHPTLATYQALIQTEAPELVHSMLVRRIRQLLQLKDNVTPEGLQGWQLSRLTGQANSFTMEKLQTMYSELLRIEVGVKSGSSPFTLAQLTQQFLVTND